jgi:hypothetical protein
MGMCDFKLPQVELQLLGENGFWVLVDCFDQKLGFDAAKHCDFTIPTPLRWKNGGDLRKMYCNLHFSGGAGGRKQCKLHFARVFYEEG